MAAPEWTAGISGQSAVAPPLNPGERAAANDLARRLRLDLLAILELMPAKDRGASVLSRKLGVDRNTCQRIVSSVSKSEADAGMLVQLPGIAGLKEFVEAIARTEDAGARGQEKIASARMAVQSMEVLIDRLAGSQRRLKERLESDVDFGDGLAMGPSDDLSARRTLFRAAAEVTGRSSEVWLTTSIIRPCDGDPGMTEAMKVRAHVGHISRAAAVPMEVGYVPHGLLKTGAKDLPPIGLLEKFCSRPLPRVTARTIEDRSIQIIEASETARNGGTDIVIGEMKARKDKHPARNRPSIGEVWSLVTFPAKRILFDVYMHRAIAAKCAASLELHLYSPQAMQQGYLRWTTRFPGGPQLMNLGVGLSKASSDAYPRHVELVSEMFAKAGWDAGDFVGYRCDVRYPVWRAGYCMVFDFAGNEMEG